MNASVVGNNNPGFMKWFPVLEVIVRKARAVLEGIEGGKVAHKPRIFPTDQSYSTSGDIAHQL